MDINICIDRQFNLLIFLKTKFY